MSEILLKFEQDAQPIDYNNVRALYIDYARHSLFQRGGFTTSFNMVSEIVEGANNGYTISEKSNNPKDILVDMRRNMFGENFSSMRITLSGDVVRKEVLSDIFPILTLQKSDDPNWVQLIDRVNALKTKAPHSHLSLSLNGSHYDPNY